MLKKNDIIYKKDKNDIYIIYNNKENLSYNDLIRMKSFGENLNLDKDEKLILINYIKLFNFIQEFDLIINEIQNKDDNLKIGLHFSEKKDIKNNNGIYNITCEYDYTMKELKYRDENILINGLNMGFQALLNDLKDE